MLSHTSGPTVRAAAATDIGRTRLENQDAILVDDEHGLFVLADGSGGGPPGALASQLSVQGLPTILQRELAADNARPVYDDQHVPSALHRSLAILSAEIRQRGDGNPALFGMGAALVVLVLGANLAYVANLGDSR